MNTRSRPTSAVGISIDNAANSAAVAMSGPPTSTERRNLAAVTDVLPYWNSHDVAGILRFYDPDICWRNRPLEEIYRGNVEVSGFLTGLFAAFPDLTFAVNQRVAQGDMIAEEWVMKGTHRGTFAGVPATGRTVEIHGMSMIEMRSARFLRDDFYFDNATVMRQLGLMPSLAAIHRRPGHAALRVAVAARRSWDAVRRNRDRQIRP